MARNAKRRGEIQKFYHFIYETHHHDHTNEPCIIASHALLLCNVVRKWARFGSAASAGFVAAPALVTGECSDGYACEAWSKVSGGVASLGDGVGDGDKDSGGVEPVEWVKLRREGPYACGCA